MHHELRVCKIDSKYSTDVQLLCRRILQPKHKGQTINEYKRLLYRLAVSPSDVLEFSYVHNVAVGLIAADLVNILNDPSYNCESNAADCHGMTPLHWAAIKGNLPALRALLRAQVNVGARDHEERIPLHWAACSGSHRCVELLLIAGSNVLAQDRSGYQAIHYAARYSDDKDMLDTLLLAGADIHSRTIYGGTALHLASTYGQPNNAMALLVAGAHVDEPDNDGDTPLLDTIIHNETRTIDSLLRYSADIGHRNKYGQTILHLIARYGTSDIIMPFMSCQLETLDVDQKNNEGLTALDVQRNCAKPYDGFRDAFEALIVRCRAGRDSSLNAEPVEAE